MHHHGRIPPQLPPLFGGTPQSLLQEAKATVARIKAIWDQVVLKVTPETATIENVILPVAHNENETKLHVDVIYFLATVHPVAEMREAAKDARRFIDDAEVDLYLRDDMFKLVDAILKKKNEASTEPEIYRFLLKSNLDNDQSGMWVTQADLDGLPTDFIGALRKGEGEDQDLVWVNMKRPHLARILKFAKSEDTRRRYYIQQLNRVPANIPLHREIILLRDSLARQKGWNSWAGLKMSEKMMKSPETVLSILAEMHPRLYEKGLHEADDLLTLKKADVADPKTKLFFWDILFYENAKQEKAAYIKNKIVMDYFEVNSVVKRILSIYERLFDIEFELVTPERVAQLHGDKCGDSTWQDDVCFYIVWDKGNEDSFLGYIYFDLHPRLGKYTHAGHYNLQKTSGSSPSLLNVGEVRSLFHEVGHGMHNILSVTKFARFHGPKVDKDFVETPSILFEYFLWTPQHIREVSCHYSYISPAYKEAWHLAHPDEQNLPSKYLTDDLIQGALSGRETGLSILRQFHFSTYDLTVHNPSSREELKEVNFGELYNKLWVKIVPSNGGEALGQGWEWAHGESVMRLIMGQYDAGQYAYILGRMWAADIFDTFAANTMDKEAGRRYRQMILRPGGSQPEWKTLTDYLGRLPSPDAFYRHIGIM
ncbi:Saccharolysin [Cytospora mali]|uniref:Saccharolysin n=1 Tax=Cytospora mali TaxID=578113 RepID=A0A194VZW8_CYTMA|nr:Saccharolysin [Valsa mali]